MRRSLAADDPAHREIAAQPVGIVPARSGQEHH